MSKPLSSFYSGRGTQGVGSYCRPCHCKRGKERWARYSDKQKVVRRNSHLMQKYGITIEEHAQKLADQGGCCAICTTDVPGGQGAFNVDHDHKCCPGSRSCGKCLRGLLCHSCNAHLHDDPGWHQRAIAYLGRFAR